MSGVTKDQRPFPTFSLEKQRQKEKASNTVEIGHEHETYCFVYIQKLDVLFLFKELFDENMFAEKQMRSPFYSESSPAH
jgi:hypothetical protein